MEDIISKTTELASLVSSLQQQEGDTSDLSRIVEQLEAAVARRSLPLASTPLLLETKTEPVDPVEPVQQDPPTTSECLDDEEKLPQESQKDVTPTKRGQRKAKRESTRRKPYSKTDTKARRGRRPKQRNTEESLSEIDQDVDDQLTDFGLYETKIEAIDSPIRPDLDPYEESDNDRDDDFVPDEPTRNVKGGTHSLAFSGSCKLCEVQAKLESRNNEGTLSLLTDSCITEVDMPVYHNLTSFANHLKKTHMFTIDDYPHKETKRNTAHQQDREDMSTADERELADQGAVVKAANAPSQQAMFMACPFCEKKYNFHGTAKSCYDQCVSHMHRKHGEALPSHVTLHNCPDCHFQTLRRRDLTRHTYVVHTDHASRGVPCEICGKCVLPTSMVLHMAAVHGSEDVPDQVKARTAKAPCHICGKEFRGEVNLQRHIKCVHSKIKEQLCHLCSQSFFAKRELQLHMFSTHKINISNMKVYKCPEEGCTYETLARRHLHIHSSVHTETKDFTCEHCGKAFKSKPALSQHLRIMHTKDVHYRCPKCTFTSHAKQYVQRHMVIHSDNKKHKCDFESCTYATHFIENLTKHKRKHRIGKE